DGNDNWYFTAELAGLNALLNNPLGETEVEINELELLTIHREGFEGWKSYAMPAVGNTPSELGQAIRNIYGADAHGLFTNTAGLIKFAQDVIKLGADEAQLFGQAAIKDLETIFKWISSFAENLGSKWMVRLPYSCIRIDPESGLDIYTEEPTNEGGWTESSEVIGLPHPSIYTDWFAQEDGRLGCFVGY